MTLPSSGLIKASDINIELGRPANQAFSMNDSAVRALAGKPSGTIKMSDFWGKSNTPQLPTTQQSILTASDGASNDQFGSSVALSANGSVAVVGAIFNDSPASNAGSAYIYVRSGSTWSQQAKLTAADQISTDIFGRAVGISADGNTVIVGAPYHDASGLSNSGAAYVFTKSGSTWSQQAKLTASTITAGASAGRSVALSSNGNTAIIGCYGFNKAYVFTRSGSTWSQQAELVPSDTFWTGIDKFGYSSSISGDGNTVVVGAYDTYDTSGTPENALGGTAYVFTRSGSTWSQSARLAPTVRSEYARFGYSVAIAAAGSTIVIGAARDFENAGAAYVFTKSGSTWSQQASLTANPQMPIAQFGYYVSINGTGDTVFVGSPTGDFAGTDTGAAYVFTRSGSTWSQQALLTPSNAANSDQFGSALAISEDGSTAMVASEFSLTKGAVYVFSG